MCERHLQQPQLWRGAMEAGGLREHGEQDAGQCGASWGLLQTEGQRLWARGEGGL